jgi:hypothetical protein
VLDRAVSLDDERRAGEGRADGRYDVRCGGREDVGRAGSRYDGQQPLALETGRRKLDLIAITDRLGLSRTRPMTAPCDRMIAARAAALPPVLVDATELQIDLYRRDVLHAER